MALRLRTALLNTASALTDLTCVTYLLSLDLPLFSQLPTCAADPVCSCCCCCSNTFAVASGGLRPPLTAHRIDNKSGGPCLFLLCVFFNEKMPFVAALVIDFIYVFGHL